ncbi:MAG: peptidyl-prolyl cis-trans isomerase [Deltaproteobacteria bacterium]|nr:peptidyl-prolyl cis-trans isomerase [Deltaproteobacteria bacterium]
MLAPTLKSALSGLVLTALMMACDRGAPAGPPALPPGVSPIARVGNEYITVEDLQEQINHESPFIRMRYSTPEKKREFLDNLIRFEVMAIEARAKGYTNDPDIVRVFKQQMVARLIQKEFEQQYDPAQLPEEDVKAYYDSNRAKFDNPEERHWSQIVVADEKSAEQVMAEARKLRPEDQTGFETLVRQKSIDTGSRERGGDMGTVNAADKRLPPQMLASLFAAKSAGALIGPYKTSVGFVVMRLNGIEPAVTRSYENAKALSRSFLFKEVRQKALVNWVSGLRARSDVKIFDENMAKVKVDTTNAPPKLTDPPVVKYLDQILPGKAANSGESP